MAGVHGVSLVRVGLRQPRWWRRAETPWVLEVRAQHPIGWGARSASDEPPPGPLLTSVVE
ncbi:hypothetical protein DDE18_18970 [Nocardioides gansuensis]|uniref:Uncharacterized protein n=1 Tax=Nocardioides gansuensis TaxID=2138300 RepID=A0A2T8F694_9ACTN|nr:hypothetical protein DDE18_18970 [Nocardioides gansuensis]